VKSIVAQPLDASADNAPILPRAARRDIVVLVCVKLAALLAIYLVFFAPHEQPPLKPAQVMTQIFSHSRLP
jgi:hypothetical protein